jgi:hypothetical protein
VRGWGLQLGSLRSFARDGRLRCHRLESPSDPPPEVRNMVPRGGPTHPPPELGNMVPRGGPSYPSRIMEHAYLYLGGTVTFVSMYQVRARTKGIIY